MSRQPNQSGFTVIELIVAVIVVTVAGVLVFTQMASLKTSQQDEQRKTAINAMHYALEEVYYPQHKSYPATLKSDILPSVDPALFTDPTGFTLGKDTLTDEEKLLLGTSPNYHYDATDCDTDGNCKGYTLRADMAAEAEYVKKNRSR